MRTEAVVKLMMSACATFLLASCAISTKGLIPEPPVSGVRQIDKQVQLMPVQGGRSSSFGREAYITNEQYRDAMRQALLDAGSFRVLADEGPTDWQLFSEIITITTEGGVSPMYAIVVQYWLVETDTGNEIWRKGINTRQKVNWNEAFAGGTRIIMAINGATKKNLSGLIEALSKADLPN